MGKVKAHANLHNDKHIYLGAIAGMVSVVSPIRVSEIRCPW